MSRVLITGSADGLGLMAAKLLAKEGHQITLHARDDRRAAAVRALVGRAEGVVVGDVSRIAGMRQVAEQAGATGAYDAVIHNVAVGYREPRRADTADGLEHVFAVNVLAPYVLTALLPAPRRLVYLSSGMHRSGSADLLGDPQWKTRRWDGSQAYSDSKLFDVVLAFAVARRWPGVFSNAVHPGWVPTRMGGAGAPDDLDLGAVTQAWLAVSDDAAAKVSGRYFHHQKAVEVRPDAREERLQDAVLAYCASLTGITLPDAVAASGLRAS
jgi:NAD(P)-dependent dehydrogenase (short-subunit alcohol dehydrogenase family)